MFKFLNFLVRRPGMTPEEFRNHYDNTHVPLSFRTFPQILEHRRNYPQDGGAFFPEGTAQPWDCVAELWFEDRKGFDDMMKFLSDPVASAEVIQDGMKFLDMPKCGMLLVDESVTTRKGR